MLLEFSSGGVRSRRRRRDAPAAAATDAATTTCASDTGSATASQRITRSDGRGGSSGGGHETRGQHRSIEPSRRKSRQKRQGGDRALRDGRQAFLPVVDERVADLFCRDRPRHQLVSRLGTCFRHTMVAGGFGPYHCLWRGGTQTKRTGAIHTPWVTPPALGLGSIHWGDEW